MTDKTPTMEELKALLAQFSAADVKKLLKETEANKPTLLSLTMDAIVTAGISGQVITENVCKAVTESARTAGVLKADESATTASVASLIRYASAYDAALKRAGLEIAKAAVVEPETSASDTPPVEPSAPVTPKDEPNKDRKRAA